MEKILECTKEFDVDLFDKVVGCFYAPSSPEHRRAGEVLLAFREHPDSWVRTSNILKESRDVKSKIFALQVLERAVKMRWSLLTDEQQSGVREYVVESILENGVEQKAKEEAKALVKRLNQVLIEIIKREWPEKWPTLISDLLGASKGDVHVCTNTFNLLESLSDEIFNFPKSVTSRRSFALQAQMTGEFTEIFGLLKSILEDVSTGAATLPDELVEASMGVLLKITPHLPIGFVLQTSIASVVCRYIDSVFSVQAISILKEMIGRRSVESGEESSEFFEMLRSVFVAVSAFVEKYFGQMNQQLKAVYSTLSDKDSALVKQIVLFYSGAFGYVKHLERLGCNTVDALTPILEISEVPEFEIFRLCTEFWSKFVKDLFLEFPFSPAPAKQPAGLRRSRYAAVLARLARVFVAQMPRPEEVIITEDDDGEIVLERLEETEHVAHYREVKETLFNIASIISGGLTTFLLAEAKQLHGASWTREKVNKISWAVGAIAESMSLSDEKEFLVQVLRVLLQMCEQKNDEGDRAVVASSVMYIVVQNPRFLKSYWKFLEVVCAKLFEFMRESHRGVQDMACEIFLKIAVKCGTEFSVVQQGESRPYIEDVLKTLPDRILLLKPYQVEMIYESLAYMVEERVSQLLCQPMKDVIDRVLDTPDGLQRTIHAVRRIKVVCSTDTTPAFLRARERVMEEVFPHLQRTYDTLSSAGSSTRAANQQVQRYVASLKRDILELFTVIANRFAIEFVLGNFMSVCSQIILLPLTSGGDLDPRALELLAALTKRTVQGTLSMVQSLSGPIAKVVLSDPIQHEELFKAFYKMVCAAAKTDPHFNTIEVIEWLAFGASQTHREVSESCIEVLAHILRTGSMEVIQLGYFGILECIIGAALDKDHEGGIVALIEAVSTLVKYSIEERCPPQSQVLEVFGTRLHQTFSHLSPSDIKEFIDRCYEFVNSHQGLADNIDDFKVKIKTV
ncbi:exportin-1 [Nematocida displodere]|uniref:Exportin-1 n=1 Tax=Nematocida displodere TaxID=1805483 RepID=A0A177EL30_9MICR|nr:exportin-1 [Nematocida displodere]